jgi:hypothetical protein
MLTSQEVDSICNDIASWVHHGYYSEQVRALQGNHLP